LIQEISNHKQDLKQYNFFVIAVNDGSTEDLPEDFDYKNIPATVLNLKINNKSKKTFIFELLTKYSLRKSSI
jgi:hypothetical protein